MNAQTALAWSNVTHNKARAAAGVSGVAFAILLMFMQLGFYDTCFRSSTMVLDQLDFDIALRSPQYAHLRAAGAFPRRRLYQAAAVPGVASAVPFYVGNGVYQEPTSRLHREIIVLAIDPRTQPFALPALAQHVRSLASDDTAVMDATTRRDYDPVRAGQMPVVEGRRLQIVATYEHGTGFVADASIVVSDRTFSRLFPGYPLSDVALGLVKLRPGVGAASAVERLRAVLPADVEVLPRPALEAYEQRFYVRVKPLGIMFTSGVALAFCVGAVIVYQVLASEITNRLREYATLKAMGHHDGFVSGVVVNQAVLYAALGVIPATLLAYVLYGVTGLATNLPMVMTASRIVLVWFLTVAMSVAAAMLAIRKTRTTDPADLFA